MEQGDRAEEQLDPSLTLHPFARPQASSQRCLRCFASAKSPVRVFLLSLVASIGLLAPQTVLTEIVLSSHSVMLASQSI